MHWKFFADGKPVVFEVDVEGNQLKISLKEATEKKIKICFSTDFMVFS